VPLKYSCFISHKNGQDFIAEAFLRDFHKALQGEAKMLKPYDCFVDYDRLKPGHLYNELLARKLCQSACLVVIYTPRYFDTQALYCAREYRAMELLEEARFAELGIPKSTNGLIIPVVLRGREDLPVAISSKRQFCDFENFFFGGRPISEQARYAEQMRDLARYISERCTELERIPAAFDDCDQSSLPLEADIKPWLNAMLSPRLKLPSRES